MDDPTPQELETPDPSENESESGQSEPQEPTEFFSDKFDPATLPPELQKRYGEMNADYTQKTQSLAEQRKEAEEATQFIQSLEDEETRKQLLKGLAEEFGYEIPEDELEELLDDDDEQEFRDPRVDDLLAEKSQRDADDLKGVIESEIGKQTKAAKLDLNEKAQAWVFDKVLELGLQHGGVKTEAEIVEMAVGDFKDILDGHVESVKKAKPEAPAPPLPPGNSPTPTPTGDTDKARRQRALDAANKSFANSQ